MKSNHKVRKITFTVAFILIGVSFSNCSIFSNENDPGNISAVIEEEDLVIRNDLPFDVYYFAVAQSSLPYITWAPLVEDFNRVPQNEFKVVKVDSLFAYDEGEPVAFFYWDEDVSEIFNILIE